MNMIRTTQTLKFFGIICCTFFTGTAFSDKNVSIDVFTDKNVSTESQCITPIEYFIKPNLNIQNNSFIIDSAALVNVSCTLLNIKVNIGQYCDAPRYKISNDISDNFTSSYWAAKVLTTFLLEDQFNLDIHINEFLEEKGSKNATVNEREKNILPGMYWINARYNCNLSRVATIFTYTDESEEKKLLSLLRIPAEWIVPYWESPATKAKFTIRINHKKTETAISHMPVQSISCQENTRYTLFYTTPIMSTSLVSAVVVPTEIVTDKSSLLKQVTIRSRQQVINGISYARSVIEDITQTVRYKWKDVIRSHVHYVILPLNSSDYESVVTTGLVLFREADMVYNKTIDSVIKKRKVTCLVARGVIQEIFSNWLATFNQSDLWFIEGFSTYYGVYIVNQISDKSLLASIMVQTRREYFDYTETFINYNISVQGNSFIPRNSIFSKLWEIKVFILFDMLNGLFYTHNLEEIIMTEAVNVYYKTYNKYSTPSDIWTNLEFNETLKEFMYSETENIKNVMTSWTTEIGYPVVQVKRDTDEQSLTIMVTDCFVNNQSVPCERKWWIPITYLKIQNRTISWNQACLKSDEENIWIRDIAEDAFIIILRPTGYRVNYDRTSWKKIAIFLKNIELEGIRDVIFAQIVDDVFYFLVQNSNYNGSSVSDGNNLDIFLDLVNTLYQDKTSYIQWYPMLTALEYMSKIFPFPESANIKDTILRMLNRFLASTSHKKFPFRNDVSNELYYEVVKWTCILDGLQCREHVTAILHRHLDNPAKNKLLPNWQKWIYCQGLMLENITYEKSNLWQIILNMYPKREIVEFLACSKHDNNIALSFYLLKENLNFVPVRGLINASSFDSITVLFDMFAKHSKNAASLDIMAIEIKTGILRFFSKGVFLPAAVNFIINNIYSETALTEITGIWYSLTLFDIFNADWAKFVVNAIEKKLEYRRCFLAEMRYNIHNKSHEVLNYKKHD